MHCGDGNKLVAVGLQEVDGGLLEAHGAKELDSWKPHHRRCYQEESCYCYQEEYCRRFLDETKLNVLSLGLLLLMGRIVRRVLKFVEWNSICVIGVVPL